MKNIYKTICSFLLACLFMVANTYAAQVSQTELEREVMAISAKLRCAVCQNQSVSESNSGLAQDMRASIREQLQSGKSEAEIIDFFVARYGDYILISPRRTGIGLPLWVLPPVLLLLISFFVFMVFRGDRNQPVAPVPELDEEDKRRVRHARETDSDEEKR
jgi:cytochrome c-type biogenesis protein CcmH